MIKAKYECTIKLFVENVGDENDIIDNVQERLDYEFTDLILATNAVVTSVESTFEVSEIE